MRFLVRVVPMDNPPVPPEEVLQQTLATFDYWEQLTKKGKVVGGPFAGEKGGAGIIEVESPEELHAILGEAPNSGITNYEVHALTTFENAKTTMRQQLETLEALKKTRR